MDTQFYFFPKHPPKVFLCALPPRPRPVPKGHDEGLHEIHQGEDAERSSGERRDGGGTRAAALIPYINLRCILLHVLR